MPCGGIREIPRETFDSRPVFLHSFFFYSSECARIRAVEQYSQHIGHLKKGTSEFPPKRINPSEREPRVPPKCSSYSFKHPWWKVCLQNVVNNFFFVLFKFPRQIAQDSNSKSGCSKYSSTHSSQKDTGREDLFFSSGKELSVSSIQNGRENEGGPGEYFLHKRSHIFLCLSEWTCPAMDFGHIKNI